MKKRIIFGTTAVALVGAITAAMLMTGFTGGKQESTATQVRTSELKKGDLAVSVSATGTVYSQNATSVYSNMSYPIRSVTVSVGDKVSEGDVLAELDLSEMEDEIAQKRASLSSSQASASHSLQTAQSDLTTYYNNVQNGNDSELLNAKASVDSAELELESAALDVESSEWEVEDAQDQLSEARDDLDDAEDEGAEDTELDQLEDAVDSARSNITKAQTSLEKAKASYTKAEQNLTKAKESYEATKVSVQDKYADYQEKVESAALNTNFTDQQLSISQLEAELQESMIVSPVSGTVTEVYAEAGASGSGLLFIIQDTDKLKVVANIKEYDVGTVNLGDRVVITTDATGDTEIDGTLSKIAPTSTLTSTGDMSSSSTEAEYQSEITVSSSGSKDGLKIGMNAQLSIVTEERKDVFTVLYDAVAKTPDGSVVYTMQPGEGENTGFTAKAVKVETGLENDLYIEVSGEGLSEGMTVISDVTGITEGMAVEPRGQGQPDSPAGNGGAPNQGGGMGMMPGMGGGPGRPM